MSQGERRLAAIMFTDMVGYTSLTQRDEALALKLLEKHNEILRPIFAKYQGREIKTIGDSFLVEFDSALAATTCAIEIQRTLREYNSSSKDDWRISLRIGIHLGDVIHSGQDVLGDAVNIASRIQPLAEPGGVCVSQQVYDQVRNKLPGPLVELQQTALKNVQYPVHSYKLVMPWDEPVPSAAKAGPPEAGRPLPANRIVVLPFVNISPDPNDDYFADGLTEELIGKLSESKGLEVVARTSSMSYKKKTSKVSEIAKELGVGTVVEGSVRKAGNRIRVTVQLIDAASEAHLWASNYDREMDDIFAIQSDIASKVAGSIPSNIPRAPLSGSTETRDISAYTFFLKGRELLRYGTEPSVRQAIDLFRRAIDQDGSFARAHYGLASCHQFLTNTGYEPYEEGMASVRGPLMKALELDPALAEAHAALSLLMFNSDDTFGAEAEARKAIELNPSLPEAYEALTDIASLKGDLEETVRLIETYYRLDPVRQSYVYDLGRAYLYAGKEKEALEHWRKTADLAPAGTYRSMTEYYLWKGDFGKAEELYSVAVGLDLVHPWGIWMKGFIAARKGDRGGAELAIRKIEESQMGVAALNFTGYVYYALNDLDSYFRCLNEAFDHHALLATYPMFHPLFADGRSDRRYNEMTERIKATFEVGRC